MLRGYRAQAAVCFWGGVGFLLLGYFVGAPGSGYETFGKVLMFGGYVLSVAAGFQYAQGKGYAWELGALGLLGPLGWVVLYVMRDRSAAVLKRRAKEERS